MSAVRFMKAGLWLLLIAGFISSCSPNSTPPGANSIGGSVGGTLYSYHYWQEGLAILIWHDFSYGESGCGGSSSTEDPVYRLNCDVEAHDGRRFSWEVHSSDGLTAEMWIDGDNFDLSQGTLFLVSSQDSGTQVVQVQRDFSELEPANETISALASSDDAIANFVARAKVIDDPLNNGANDGLIEFLGTLRVTGQLVELTTL
jgi:hypothetical protein